MATLTSSFSLFTSNPSHLFPSRTSSFSPPRLSIKPPPPEFDFRAQILTQSRSAIARIHPELIDLAENGTLVLIQKPQFGPVPDWRIEFVEPEVIWLVGTNHLSSQAGLDVERVVRAVQPDNVVVELCRSRAGIMYADIENDKPQQLRNNMFSMSGTGFLGAIGRSINLGGQTALALRLLLAVFSSKISSETDLRFGDEFRAARKASEEVGAQIVLGDRPIEITLERAWNSLGWNEKFSLLTSVIRGITSASRLSTESLKDSSEEDGTYQLYERLSLTFPSLLQPLIHERDTYLAWSLKRSKAVNSGKRVVGVIGKGHMNGVIYALVSDLGDLRFRDLAGNKQSSGNEWIITLAKNLTRDTIIGFILWALYEQIMAVTVSGMAP
ncbi:hypothetical protein QQ045_011226 [Rhodiola kirilowii]